MIDLDFDFQKMGEEFESDHEYSEEETRERYEEMRRKMERRGFYLHNQTYEEYLEEVFDPKSNYPSFKMKMQKGYTITTPFLNVKNIRESVK